MNRNRRELWYALLAVVLITLGYVIFTSRMGTGPASSSLFGFLLGVIGFIFMVMTETLYSLRKRNRLAARWGRADSWLRFHIFTGIVGPYMVLLHTAWRFNGLAGAVTLAMVIIVGSGFIGRYIYTMIPRTAVGIKLGGRDLETYIDSTEKQLQRWFVNNSSLASSLPQDLISRPSLSANPWALIFGRLYDGWIFRWRWVRDTRGIHGRQLRELKKLLITRRELCYQIASLMLAQRILALWHMVHVPLGIALFSTAFIHIGVALYYVVLGK